MEQVWIFCEKGTESFELLSCVCLGEKSWVGSEPLLSYYWADFSVREKSWNLPFQNEMANFKIHFPFFHAKSFPLSFSKNYLQKKKCLILTPKMKSPAIPPNLSEKLIPPGKFLKIPEWNILKKSSAKIRGKTNFHSKILNFINPKFSPKFHLLKSLGKKSEIFAKPLAGGSTATSTPFSII